MANHTAGLVRLFLLTQAIVILVPEAKPEAKQDVLITQSQATTTFAAVYCYAHCSRNSSANCIMMDTKMARANTK